MRTFDIKRVDTAYTPVDPGSYGSRVTLLAGQATQLAARDAKKQLLEAGGKVWEVKPEDIEIKNGIAFLMTNPEKRMSFEKLAKIACYEGSGAVILGRGHSSYGLGQIDFNQAPVTAVLPTALPPRQFVWASTWRRERLM